MSLLLLHGSGWDEFLLLGLAVFIAFLAVKFTMRPNEPERPDPAEPSAAADEAHQAHLPDNRS